MLVTRLKKSDRTCNLAFSSVSDVAHNCHVGTEKRTGGNKEKEVPLGEEGRWFPVTPV